MEFRVLGPLRVTRDGADVVLSGRLPRTLLAMLLARGGPVPAAALAQALWPNERAGLSRLHVTVHRLRRMLGDPARITFEQDAYRLWTEPGEVDVVRFEELADAAAEAFDPRRRAELAAEGLELWHGVPFGDLDTPELAAEASRLTERRLALVELRYEAELECGRHTAAVPGLTELVAAHPLRERLSGLLMTALDRAGRPADALAVFRTVREILVTEQGLEPGPELRAITRRILNDGPGEAEPSAPAQLPNPGYGFVGRAAELAELDGARSAGARVCVVAGTAGVGKTTTVLRWAHRRRAEFADGQLYVDLRGYGPDEPLRPADALAGFLRALGVDGASIPPGQDERAARFRTLADGRRLLIVLDNARTADQVRPLLPGSPTCFVLVTSRSSMPGLSVRVGARRIGLDRLPAADAAALLRDQVGDARVDAEPEAAAVLVERCARLPLALRIAADLITLRPAMSVADLVAELDEPNALDTLAVDGDHLTSVRAVFSWSYRRLPDPAARLFRLCGVHPGSDLDVHALAALAATTPADTRQALDVLVRAHLVEVSAAGRIRVHDLLWVYAGELAGADEHAATARLATHYLGGAAAAMDVAVPQEKGVRPVVEPTGQAPACYEDAMRWLDAERDNLFAVADLCTPAQVLQLAEVLWRYLNNGGFGDQALRLYRKALAAARQLDDRLAEANALRLVGRGEFDIGHYELAASLLEQALTGYLETGDRARQATTLNLLAGSHSVAGRLRDAVRYVEQALALHRELGDRAAEVSPLCNLGYLYGRLGEHEVALCHVRRALDLAEEHDNRGGLAHALLNLAELCTGAGDHDTALTHLHRLLALVRDHGLGGLAGEVRLQLGAVHANMGDHPRAVHHFEAAYRSARTDRDSNLTAKALIGLADSDVATGAAEAAIPRYTEALAVATTDGIRYHQGKALAGLGDAHAALGDHGTAATHWRQAHDIFRELDVPEARALADRAHR